MFTFLLHVLYDGPMTGVRARVRAEMTAEIKRLAREQIATEGAANLSLRAISREIDVSVSALYRYFPSRDHLLTALIIDSYDAIGSVIEMADEEVQKTNLRGRWKAIANCLREWALHNPSDYGLIFGTPVPGYEAPTDTVEPGTRYTNVLLRFLADVALAGHSPQVKVKIPRNLSSQYRQLRQVSGLAISDELLCAGVTAWVTLFGAVSFEIFGHLDNVLPDASLHFAVLVDMMATEYFGLPI